MWPSITQRQCPPNSSRSWKPTKEYTMSVYFPFVVLSTLTIFYTKVFKMPTGLPLILAVCLFCPPSFAAVQRRQNTTVDSAGEFTNPTNFSLPNPSTASNKEYNADGSFNVTTGYISYTQCNDAQSAALWQAVNDAISLAAGTYGHDELKKRDGSVLEREQLIDFSTQAAIDYFGPPSRSGPYQHNIFGMSLGLIVLRMIALCCSSL